MVRDRVKLPEEVEKITAAAGGKDLVKVAELVPEEVQAVFGVKHPGKVMM